MATPVVVGIAGGSGSGKTTVVENLLAMLADVAPTVLQHDRYYRDLSALALSDRATVNFDHPDALETSLLVSHLTRLRAGEAAEAPVYDFHHHVRAPHYEALPPGRLIIVEGILVLADPELRNLMDLRVFVETDAHTRLARRVRRDVDERGRSEASVRAQFLSTVQPMHERYVEPSRAFADLVIREGGFNAAAIRALADVIRARMEGAPRGDRRVRGRAMRRRE